MLNKCFSGSKHIHKLFGVRTFAHGPKAGTNAAGHYHTIVVVHRNFFRDNKYKRFCENTGIFMKPVCRLFARYSFRHSQFLRE